MQERLKQFSNKMVEVWNKYTKKQRVIILSTVGVVAIMIFLLAYFLGRTTYTEWKTFDSISNAKAAVALLDEAGIANRVGDDSMTVYVDENKIVAANMAVVDSDLYKGGLFTLEEMLDNDMSTTNYEKQIKFAAYFQSDLEQQIVAIKGVDKASISYIPVDRTSTILDEGKDTKCSVFLTINSDFTQDMAEGIAVSVASALGNSSLESVTVLDQYGNLLYNGPDDDDEVSLADQASQTTALNNLYRNQGLRFGYSLEAGYFDNVEVEVSLKINYDRVEEYLEEYVMPDGSDTGYLTHSKTISSENTNPSGDVPGTDSNDEDQYLLVTGGNGKSSYDEEENDYTYGRHVVSTLGSTGAVEMNSSSAAIVLTKVRKYSQRELELRGALDELSYEDYIVLNSQPVRQEVPEDYYEGFARAMGLDASRLQIIIYEVPEYDIIEEEEGGFNWSLLLTIILFVLIIGLLIFVVFRVSRTEEVVVETEPELSVEKLLATTKENQSLEDIEFSEKSEAKKMIEKFVDENPEAVAALLRNWLNEGWQ